MSRKFQLTRPGVFAAMLDATDAGRVRMKTIVTVAGMRDWPNKQQIFDELDALLGAHMTRWASLTLGTLEEGVKAFILRHGVSGNADNWANEWGLEHGVTIERFHADWHEPGGAYNPAAGPIRNRKMAKAEPKADLWLSFWDGKFRQRGQRKVSGSFDGIVAALEAGINVAIKPPRRN